MEPSNRAHAKELEVVSRKLSFWKDRLQDLSGRNRLLFYKPTRSSTLEIIHPPALDMFERLVVQGKTLQFYLPEAEESLEEDVESPEASSPEKVQLQDHEIGVRQPSNLLRRTLYNLRIRARTAREEQGVNVLYLALGFLYWKEVGSAQEQTAPLILLPVDIVTDAPGKPYQLIAVEEDTVLNPTLRVKLQQDWGLELPELPQDLDRQKIKRYLEEVTDCVRSFAGWHVTQQMALGIFNFQNLIIISDLEKNWNHYVNSSLMQAAISPSVSPPHPAGLISKEELDDRVSLSDTFQILDADSSQQEAIEAAKAGLSFVLQGPPGTGKSQTIANIIAEFLATGRRVLFVSQKMAALEVVKKRLDFNGVGEYCLEIHDHRRNKKDVIEELGAALERQRHTVPPDLELVSQLERLRKRLNNYIRAVHAPRFKLGISLHHAYGEYTRVRNAPALKFRLSGINQLDRTQFNDQQMLIDELTTYPDPISSYGEHPWRGYVPQEPSIEAAERLEDVLHAVSKKSVQLEIELQILAQQYQLDPPRTLADSFELLQLAQIFTPMVFALPLDEILNRYQTEYQSFLRYMRPSYWRDSAQLRDVSRENERFSPSAAVTNLELAIAVQKRRTPRAGTNLNIAPTPLDADRLLAAVKLADAIKSALLWLAKQFSAEKRPDLVPLLYDHSVAFDALSTWCKRQADAVSDLDEWLSFQMVYRRGQSIGLEPFVVAALDAELDVEKWRVSFLRQFYLQLIDAIIQSDSSLRTVSGAHHQQLIEKFRKWDVEFISTVAPRALRARLESQKPEVSWMSAASSEETILRREMNKQRRIKALRLLFSEIPELILSLKPCLMMSPITVSQLLDPQLYQFDLVIFDEASQITPEYAIGAIARAKQVIVAGDKQQLPPSRFFQALESEYIDSLEDIDDFESILNELEAAGFPNKRLLWHYRSRDESLIAFSNYHFYSNQLFTFPSSGNGVERVGVEFEYVEDGVYGRGKSERDNRVEAQRIVDFVLEHAKNSSNLSLGVVAFSDAQRHAIQVLLDSALQEMSTIPPFFLRQDEEALFVKALENVQGDERDVMIFSVGYGPDELGKMTMNFGPLNRSGGERRLNVAVTRARQRVILVASFQPEDIDLSRSNSKGVSLLRSYMVVARDGLKSLFNELSLEHEGEFDSPFEEDVYRALVEAGLTVRTQVGVSGYRIDMAVVDPNKPGRFLLGIECDGAMYHSAATARDRDRLRQQVLENLGWRIHRIWSRDWFTDPAREVSKVLSVLKTPKQASERPNRPTVSPMSSHSSMRSAMSVPSVVSPPSKSLTKPATRASRQNPHAQQIRPRGTVPYRRSKLRKSGGIERFYSTSTSVHAQVLKTVVHEEGPIEMHAAFRRAAEAWDIKRVGSRVQEALSRAMNHAQASGLIRVRDGFLWPPDMQVPPVRTPAKNEGKRTIEEIALEEIAEGVMLCMQAAFSLNEEDIIRESARIFDLRTSAATAARVKLAIQQLRDTSRLNFRDGKYRLPR